MVDWNALAKPATIQESTIFYILCNFPRYVYSIIISVFIMYKFVVYSLFLLRNILNPEIYNVAYIHETNSGITLISTIPSTKTSNYRQWNKMHVLFCRIFESIVQIQLRYNIHVYVLIDQLCETNSQHMTIISLQTLGNMCMHCLRCDYCN